MSKKKRSVLEGDDDGEGHPWKALKDKTYCNVFYGAGFHEKLRMQKAEVTSVEAVKSKIHAHREKKRLAEADGGGGGKGKKARAEAAAIAAEAEEGGFAADSQTRDRKSADYMNLDGPQRDYAAARETTKRNKAAAKPMKDELEELREAIANGVGTGDTGAEEEDAKEEEAAVDLLSLVAQGIFRRLGETGATGAEMLAFTGAWVLRRPWRSSTRCYVHGAQRPK